MTAMTAGVIGRLDFGGGGSVITEIEATEVDLGLLYDAYRLELVRLARLLVDETAAAEDVVHDVFVKLHRAGLRLDDAQAARAYLRTAVVNGARSVLRRRQLERRHASTIEDEHADGADHAVILAAEHRHVLEAVNRLPIRQREVLVLRYWSGLSEAEIAQALSISPGSVKSHASRAMAKLGATLGGLSER